jgi:hypothetical protein
MIQAQMYNFLRLRRVGYEAIVANMLANAWHLNASEMVLALGPRRRPPRPRER